MIQATPASAESGSIEAAVSKVDRWDYVSVGGIIDGGGHIQLGTYTHRHARITLFEARIGMSAINGFSFDWHAGMTVGFGDHHGSDLQFSHWFITGAWAGQVIPMCLFATCESYTGFFIPFGYEFRHYWGKARKRVWGFRLYGAYSPVGVREIYGSCDPDGWFCDSELRRIRLPLMAGLMIFIGY